MPSRLKNSQFADLLDLRSDFRGNQHDYLTYSILGGLLKQERIKWDEQTKLFSKA